MVWEASMSLELASLSQMETPRLFIQPMLLSCAIREKSKGEKIVDVYMVFCSKNCADINLLILTATP